MAGPGEGAITRTKRNGKIVIKDGAAHSLEVPFGPGDLQLNIPGEAIILSLDRGRITDPPDLAPGDDQPMSGSFSARLRTASKTAVGVLRDIITNSGFVASDWVTTAGRDDVRTYTVEWHIDAASFGEESEIIRLPYCRLSGSLQEGEVNTISVSVESFATYPEIELAA